MTNFLFDPVSFVKLADSASEVSGSLNLIQIAADLGHFTIKTSVIVIALIILIAFVASIIAKDKGSDTLKVKNLNKKYKNQSLRLRRNLLDKKSLKQWIKSEKKSAKELMKGENPNLFVLDFKGDIKASACDHLREEISSLLMVAQPYDKVVVRLESPGGMVHGYGLATSQLQRIKDKGIELIVCVDKVAASGGYMMACVADKIISAPYAIIGSIGVIASVPNVHKLLRKNDIDYLEITAGEYKRTITPLGEITEPGMKKFREQIEQVHELFKQHVGQQRPNINMDQVATGEYWYGLQAKDLGLVDEIGTSDDYILTNLDNYRILSLTYEGEKSFKQKLAENLSATMDALITKVLSLNWSSRFQ
jgi:serine protease SohB